MTPDEQARVEATIAKLAHMDPQGALTPEERALIREAADLLARQSQALAIAKDIRVLADSEEAILANFDEALAAGVEKYEQRAEAAESALATVTAERDALKLALPDDYDTREVMKQQLRAEAAEAALATAQVALLTDIGADFDVRCRTETATVKPGLLFASGLIARRLAALVPPPPAGEAT